mmetsp:Transcript_13698/g.34886  ORF Transcript_13698/g.34886 Transcript_13698/m.34886 type:complete len:256 (-) Transcript_13698:96-863(-)
MLKFAYVITIPRWVRSSTAVAHAARQFESGQRTCSTTSPASRARMCVFIDAGTGTENLGRLGPGAGSGGSPLRVHAWPTCTQPGISNGESGLSGPTAERPSPAASPPATPLALASVRTAPALSASPSEPIAPSSAPLSIQFDEMRGMALSVAAIAASSAASLARSGPRPFLRDGAAASSSGPGSSTTRRPPLAAIAGAGSRCGVGGRVRICSAAASRSSSSRRESAGSGGPDSRSISSMSVKSNSSGAPALIHSS